MGNVRVLAICQDKSHKSYFNQEPKLFMYFVLQRKGYMYKHENNSILHDIKMHFSLRFK